jgi:hypothetical protein
MRRLHEDIWTLVIPFLETSDLLNVMTSSRKMYLLCDNEFQWTMRINRHYSNTHWESNQYFNLTENKKKLYKSLRRRINGTNYFNTGDYFLQHLEFGTVTCYHYLIELDILPKQMRFIPQHIRKQAEHFFPHAFYASEIEFFSGKTRDISRATDHESSAMFTYGIKWGSYLSMFQLYIQDPIYLVISKLFCNCQLIFVDVLSQTSPDGLIIDGVWRNPDYHGLFSSLKINASDHAELLMNDIQAPHMVPYKQHGIDHLMRYNYQQKHRRQRKNRN